MKDVENEVAALLEQARTLVRLIDEAVLGVDQARSPSLKETRRVVNIYVKRLEEAISSRDQEQVLRACNVLTSTNKGVSDTVWADDCPCVSRQALVVSHQAWAAGDQVRRIVGHL